jgi:Spy/CpxP family protein refolding chaperone
MKARSALGGLALILGMTLPAAAEPPAGMQLAQAPTDTAASGARSHWGHRSHGRHGHHGWHRRAKAHRFSLGGLALRHQKELALTSAQVESLRKLGTDARREAIKRQTDRRLAELDLRALMAPDPADPDKPRDLSRIETKVREIEKLRGDERVARFKNLEQSRQVLTAEQREKLRTLLSQRGHRSHRRGMAPDDGAQKPSAAESTPTTS